MSRSWLFGPLVGAVLVLNPGVSAAQVTPEARAVGRELFMQGRALLEQQEYARACEKFAESQRLDPGGGTLLNLAICHEKMGRTASAWVELGEARRVAELDGRADRADLAREHIDALGPKLTRLRIEVPEAARVPGLVILLDGVALGQAALDDALPIDPGVHSISSRAPGRAPWSAQVEALGEGHIETIEVLPTAILAEPLPAGSTPPHEPVHPQRVAGLAVAGAGVLVLGGALGYYVAAVGTEKASDRECPSSDLCTSRGIDLNRTARHYADAATGLAVGGLVVIGIGTALYLLAPKRARAGAALIVTPGSPRTDIDSWPVYRF